LLEVGDGEDVVPVAHDGPRAAAARLHCAVLGRRLKLECHLQHHVGNFVEAREHGELQAQQVRRQRRHARDAVAAAVLQQQQHVAAHKGGVDERAVLRLRARRNGGRQRLVSGDLGGQRGEDFGVERVGGRLRRPELGPAKVGARADDFGQQLHARAVGPRA
jgi:hypothetical protein